MQSGAIRYCNDEAKTAHPALEIHHKSGISNLKISILIISEEINNHKQISKNLVGANRRVSQTAERLNSRFKNNYFAEIFSCSEEGSYLRLKDFCITQL